MTPFDRRQPQQDDGGWDLAPQDQGGWDLMPQSSAPSNLDDELDLPDDDPLPLDEVDVDLVFSPECFDPICICFFCFFPAKLAYDSLVHLPGGQGLPLL